VTTALSGGGQKDGTEKARQEIQTSKSIDCEAWSGRERGGEMHSQLASKLWSTSASALSLEELTALSAPAAQARYRFTYLIPRLYDPVGGQS